MTKKTKNETKSSYMAHYREMWQWTITDTVTGNVVLQYIGNKYNDENCEITLEELGVDTSNATRGSDQDAVLFGQFEVRRVLCSE